MLSYYVDGIKIREAREKRGLSVAELAAAAGISPGFLYKIETGAKQPGGKTVRSLTDALEISVDDVLGAAKPRLVRRPPATSKPETS